MLIVIKLVLWLVLHHINSRLRYVLVSCCICDIVLTCTQFSGLVHVILLMHLLNHGDTFVWWHLSVVTRPFKAIQAAFVGIIVIVSVVWIAVFVQEFWNSSGNVILQQFHVRILRPIQVSTNWWPNRFSYFDILDVMAWPTAFSRTSIIRVQYLTAANKASTRSKTIETRVKATVELGDPRIHIRRALTVNLILDLVLVGQIGVLLIEAVILARVWGSNNLALDLIDVFLLAAFSELIDRIRVSGRVADAIGTNLPSVLWLTDLMALRIVLLTYEACDGAMRDRALTTRDAGAYLCIKVDHASTTLEGVSAEAVRLVAVLV